MSFFLERLRQCAEDEPRRQLLLIESTLRRQDLPPDTRAWMECRLLHTQAAVRGAPIEHMCADCTHVCPRCRKCVLPPDQRQQYRAIALAAKRPDILQRITTEICLCKG